MATRRYFECRCSHKLRFGARYCGDCHDPTPSWNRYWFWRIGLALVGAALTTAIVMIAIG